MVKSDIEFFKSVVSEENVYSDKAHLIAYSYDATGEKFEADLVIFPRNEDDISRILKYCNEHKIIVVPRGAGSGFTGGALPCSGGVVLALEKHMTKIKEIDTDNMLAVVEPCVINKDLQNAVENLGLFYPPDPASQNYSTIGGNVSENAGGMRANKYGITKDYVMALRAVLPNGDIIRAGKRTIKDVAGYNIAGILIASEGTLAVITEITLKLISKPKLVRTAKGVFDSIEDAMSAVYKTMSSGVTPVTMEFLDDLVINALEASHNINIAPSGTKAMLITDIDGNLEDDINLQLNKTKEIFHSCGAKDFIIAQNEEQRDEIWFARRNASPSTTVYGTKKINEDISVPRKELPNMLNAIKEISKKYGVKIPCFGHAGDGNIHVNVMADKKDEDDVARGYKAVKEIFVKTVELGGTLSGEHGIGLSKAPYMGIAFSDEEMNLFRTIKKAFDPNNILNPDKMGLNI